MSLYYILTFNNLLFVLPLRYTNSLISIYWFGYNLDKVVYSIK